jgi:hypothetical protein
MRVEQADPALLAGPLRAAAGVVLLAALVMAPLCFGSTRLLAFETLIALAAIGGIAWLAGSIRRGRCWLPPPMARVGVVLVGVSALAWWLFLTPPEAPAFTRAHYARLAARWPYSVVPRGPGLLLAWTAAAFLAFAAFCDLARDPAWRRSIVAVMTCTGAAVALLGLAQNATHARGIYWDSSQRMPGAFFGPFFHHTSGGAYLNSVWPLAVGLALQGLAGICLRPGARTLVFGACGCAILIFAAHIAHVSRFPQVIALVALVAFAWWAGLWRILGRVRGLRSTLMLGAAAVFFLAIATGATRLNDIHSRWNLLQWEGLRGGGEAVAPPPESEWNRLMRPDLFVPSVHREYPLGDRGAMYAAALAAIAARPWFGWGPGGWMAAEAAHSADPFIRTFFLTVQFTHEDFLQTGVEWGLIGAAGWALLVPGGVLHAVRQLRGRPSRDLLGAGAAVALGAVLVQSCIDFPLQIPALQFQAVALSALVWSTPPAAAHSVHVEPFS